MRTDVDFFDLTPTDDSGGFRFTVVDRLARLDGQLYGGTAIGASIAAAEAVSGHPAVWMTTQFVSTAPADAVIDVKVELLAVGSSTTQVRVTGTDQSGAVMFASLGATGRHRPDGLTGGFEHAPEVTPVEESHPRGGPFAVMLRNAGHEIRMSELPRVGFSMVVEYREPTVIQHPDPGPGRVCMWVRRHDRTPITPALAAFIADMVPLSVASGLGVVASGMSLDNTVRIGAFDEPTEWVLIDLRPHLASNGFGHGVAHIWSEDGRLLATASQTATMRQFDLANPPWRPDDPA